ncbi:MAG: glycosyl transferase family protein [Gaiellaceae bacterium]|nr:glycosyl transferase family protein [Gaiellaceae bacterium]
MKLVASLVVRNELSRYLEPCVASLLEFCDEIRVLDDCSDDGTLGWLGKKWVSERVFVATTQERSFYVHEGRIRQQLLEWTLKAEPTHILAIDADEFVADGRMLRKGLTNQPQQEVWTLGMQEIWKADENALWIRSDGGWRAHETTALYRVPPELPHSFAIVDRALACGREPQYVRRQYRQALRTGTEILHFGWTNVSERRVRYDRYVVADGGRFHASAHLQSILFEDRRVRLRKREWPAELAAYKDVLLEKVRHERWQPA